MSTRTKQALRLGGGVALGMIVLSAVALTLMPSPIDPVAYRPEPGPPLEGPLAPNNLLTHAELWGDGTLYIPEDVAFDSEGRLYTATGDGRVLRLTRIAEDRHAVEPVADVGGHPLGLAVGPGDTLYVANHGVGLQAVAPDGGVRLLTDRYGDRPIRFADDLDVSTSGVVYFSDASHRFNNTTLDSGPPYLPLDLLEARPHGALYAYDTRSRTGPKRYAHQLLWPRSVRLTVAIDSPYPRVSVRSVLAPSRKSMRTLHASLPPAEGNALAMPTLRNDDDLAASSRKNAPSA
jgi:hypothetical protein